MTLRSVWHMSYASSSFFCEWGLNVRATDLVIIDADLGETVGMEVDFVVSVSTWKELIYKLRLHL